SLLTCAAECITEEGFFCVVLPEQIGNGFTELALSMGWHLRLRTDVAENEARLPHRVLLAFSPQAGECFSDRLVIRGPDQNYSEAYTALTQAFYLFM
ncbi:tRNA(1)(Val) (adenine(37)-N(6))-methyltransferase TrmN, partial [Escherichia coli]|nr:tRNA(1)(Val) (adenine(37)-N(6))-methyltransferase TrmN [Escherichia coli]